MSQLKKEEINIKDLGHLGIIAGMIKKTKLIKRIDRFIPISKSKGAKITIGERVAAALFNALGFVDSRLYMFSEFLKDKPISLLFGRDIPPEFFNDDAMGRCLDAIYEYGPSKLFSNLTFSIASQLNLLGKSIHIDTTSLSLHGAYESDNPVPFVTHGYSKDKRDDLKQVILELATVSKSDLPLFMNPHPGNASDQKTLIQAAKSIESIRSQIENAPSFIYVADSAMYEGCIKEGSNILWISRVPVVRKEAKRLVLEKEIPWTPIQGSSYKSYALPKVINGIKQRWILIHSEQTYKKVRIDMERKIQKEKERAGKELDRHKRKRYATIKEAEKAASLFKKRLKLHALIDVNINPIEGYMGKGRPSKDAKKTIIGYQIEGKLVEDEEKKEEMLRKKSRFILATNQLDTKAMPDHLVLEEYKAQQTTERGFAFVKDKTFEVSSVYLKKQTRIQALMMIMSLALFMYSLIQYQVRKSLKEKNELIPNQLKKGTNRPTSKWIFFLFRSIKCVSIRGPAFTQDMITNLDDLLNRILSYFGEETMKLYGVTIA